jgi:YfiH family protein
MRLEYIAPDWPAPNNIACVTTTRVGGYSAKAYNSLNLGLHVEDNEADVNKNRRLIKSDLQLPAVPAWLNQVHGSKVLNLSGKCPKNVTADAAYTNEIGVVCAVLTADCLPVLFCDQTGEYIAVVHAGWRGLLNGVLENTLHALPVANNKIMCWLGPAIGPIKFEVGEEVYKSFVGKDAKHKNAFQEKIESKYLANIYQLAKNLLNSNGVKAIYGGKYCTYLEENKFYSYRRDGQTGRMATLIWKKS